MDSYYPCYIDQTNPYYRAIAIPIGETIFVNSLLTQVPKNTQAVSPQAVVDAGATNLNKISASPTVLYALQLSYSTAVTNTLYLAIASVALALFFACGMEWKNIKHVAAEREKLASEQVRQD